MLSWDCVAQFKGHCCVYGGNIEALLLDEAAASELQHPTETEGTPSFKSLNGVAAVEQYEHLGQLLHIQKSARH